MAFLMTALPMCFSQTPTKQRWQTLLVGRDTLVQGPRSEFVLFGAKRMVSDNLRRNYAFRMAEEIKKSQSLEAELDFTRTTRDAAVMTSNSRLKEIGLLRTERDECRKQCAKDKGWAQAGRIGAVVVCVGVAVIGTVAIIGAVQ